MAKPADAAQDSLESVAPVWSCELLPKREKPFTVGELRILDCSGTDLVSIGGDYKIEIEQEGFDHLLKILSVQTDSASQKVFQVTSHLAGKGDLKFKLKDNNEVVFESLAQGVAVESVVENPNDAKPYQPIAGYYVMPGTVQIIAFVATLLSILALLAIKAVGKARKRTEFRRVVMSAQHPDPFMDFNLELRDFESDRAYSHSFLERLDQALKKVFFRVFAEPVHLEDSVLITRLKGLGLETYEVRSFVVLNQEYQRFKEVYAQNNERSITEKDEFLEQAKKTVNKLRKYVDLESVYV
jgi:hypothetical protein